MRTLAKLKYISIFLSIALLAAGCGGGKGPKLNVELVIWQPFAARQALQPIAQAFSQANKGVRVTIVDKDVTSYQSELLQALAAGRGPDIFAINNAWVPEYLDKIAPAPAAVWQEVDFRREFVNVLAEDFIKNGSIYGTAMSVDTLNLYYNKSILADAGVYTPPATWADLQVAVRKITRQDSQGYFSRSGVAMGHSSYSGGGQINRAEDIVYLLMRQLGGQAFKADGSAPTFGNSVSFNGKSIVPAVQTLQFYTSFANATSPNYTWNSTSDYSIDAFANGRLGLMFNYSYAADTIRKKNAALQFATAQAPQQDLETPAVNFANYWGQVVSKQSPNAEWAWRFLRFATTKDQLDKYLAQVKLPASRKDLLEAQTSDPNLAVFAHSAASATSMFRPHAEEVDKIFGAAIDAVVFQGQTPQQAVAQGLRQAHAIVQRKN